VQAPVSSSTLTESCNATQAAAASDEQVFPEAWRILGGVRTFGRKPNNQQDVHEAALAGVRRASLRHLGRACTALKRSDFASTLGITVRQLSHYEQTPHGAMPGHLASKAWVLAEVLAKASYAFGGVEAAQHWLIKPAVGLNGQRPIDMLRTLQGAEVVDDFLVRLEYCVYT
jgi:putative toxin-antitoxin system antitoxin component (TIGR02293 family)